MSDLRLAEALRALGDAIDGVNKAKHSLPWMVELVCRSADGKIVMRAGNEPRENWEPSAPVTVDASKLDPGIIGNATIPYSDIRFSDADGTGPAREMRRERAARTWQSPDPLSNPPIDSETLLAEYVAELKDTTPGPDPRFVGGFEHEALADATVSAELHTRAMEPVRPRGYEHADGQYLGVWAHPSIPGVSFFWWFNGPFKFAAVSASDHEDTWFARHPADCMWTLVKSP